MAASDEDTNTRSNTTMTNLECDVDEQATIRFVNNIFKVFKKLQQNDGSDLETVAD